MTHLNTNTEHNFYIGLMSGTSMDAVDAVLVNITSNTLQLIHTHTHPINHDLKNAILSLAHSTQTTLDVLGQLDTQLGHLFANTVCELITHNAINPAHIRAIGSHGQTIRHQPHGKYPFTLQIGDPNIIAAQTSITTIADFRRRDVALGGQGAPLVPAFHQFLFGTKRPQWVVNIGGIANVTLLQPHHDVIGFDTGPGNTLLDSWCYQHTGKRYDHNGDFARTGIVNIELLHALLTDPFFKKSFPKSTGFDYFNVSWLNQYSIDTLKPCDIQATLTELTAITIATTLNQHTQAAIWMCGGGSKNKYLMERLQNHCHATIQLTDAMGIGADWMEACAFAWLAHQTLHHRTSNLPSVTGAKKACVLGGVYFPESEH